MRTTNLLITGVIAGTLAACGSSGNPSGNTAATSEAAHRAAVASLPANATAEQVAAHMRGDVHCPADIKTPPLPAGAPVDDIVGARPGLTYEEAANIVMCSNPLLVVAPSSNTGFDIKTYGYTVRQGFTANFAEARVQKSGREIAAEMEQEAMQRGLNEIRHDVKPGQSKWSVGTMGTPGHERVISLGRDEWFATGHNPTTDSVEQALIHKYGPPTRKENPGRSRLVEWSYDPHGALITTPDRGCYISPLPGDSYSVSSRCGIVISARIDGMPENHGIAQRVMVNILDDAGTYAALTGTEKTLKAMDAARRAKQVKAAAKNGADVQY